MFFLSLSFAMLVSGPCSAPPPWALLIPSHRQLPLLLEHPEHIFITAGADSRNNMQGRKTSVVKGEREK